MPKPKPQQITWDEHIEAQRTERETRRTAALSESKRRDRNARSREHYAEKRKPITPVIGYSGQPIPPMPEGRQVIRCDIRDFGLWKEMHHARMVRFDRNSGLLYVEPIPDD